MKKKKRKNKHRNQISILIHLHVIRITWPALKSCQINRTRWMFSTARGKRIPCVDGTKTGKCVTNCMCVISTHNTTQGEEENKGKTERNSPTTTSHPPFHSNTALFSVRIVGSECVFVSTLSLVVCHWLFVVCVFETEEWKRKEWRKKKKKERLMNILKIELILSYVLSVCVFVCSVNSSISFIHSLIHSLFPNHIPLNHHHHHQHWICHSPRWSRHKEWN